MRQADLPDAVGYLFAAAICIVSVAFKIAFTWNDEPELVQNVATALPTAMLRVLTIVQQLDLVRTARAAFLCIAGAAVYLNMSHISRPNEPGACE